MVALGKVIEEFQRPVAVAAKAKGGGDKRSKDAKSDGGSSPKRSKPRDESKRTSSVAAAACGVDRRTARRGRLAEACERFGIAYKTAAQAAWVAGAFESSSRLEDLSFGHYDAVCGSPQAGELLEWAAESGATVKQLRERVREIKSAASFGGGLAGARVEGVDRGPLAGEPSAAFRWRRPPSRQGGGRSPLLLSGNGAMVAPVQRTFWHRFVSSTGAMVAPVPSCSRSS